MTVEHAQELFGAVVILHRGIFRGARGGSPPSFEKNGRPMAILRRNPGELTPGRASIFFYALAASARYQTRGIRRYRTRFWYSR